MFDWSGENVDKLEKKSGNFDILCEWQPREKIVLWNIFSMNLHLELIWNKNF